MTIPFSAQLSVPADVLVSEVGNELVLLDLRSEQYFGLDEVGADMWNALTHSGSVKAAFERLVARYQVDEEQLWRDLQGLLTKLQTNGLIEIHS